MGASRRGDRGRAPQVRGPLLMTLPFPCTANTPDYNRESMNHSVKLAASPFTLPPLRPDTARARAPPTSARAYPSRALAPPAPAPLSAPLLRSPATAAPNATDRAVAMCGFLAPRPPRCCHRRRR
eukprot:1890656-Rhodomonas_salina.2